ncbi:hypothetical protein Csa_004854 [Cucumis sativus]|nr:hypothetical protein Csa_004854 [Cucumis sativus]
MTNLGNFRFFLGLEIQYISKGLNVLQSLVFLGVIVEMLKKYGMSSAKPCSTPMALPPPSNVGDPCTVE